MRNCPTLYRKEVLPGSVGEGLSLEGHVSAQASADERQCLVIGVCTRGRNALLRRLLESLLRQAQPVGYDVKILIIDNNDVPCATEALQGLPPHFPISVVHEPKVGLVFARNRALNEAVLLDAAWFLGLDDDEWVEPDWLATMISGTETMEREIIMGSQYLVYDETLSPYVRPKQMTVPAKGLRPRVMSTANFGLHKCVFDPRFGPGLRFDPYFNERGGEDTAFFAYAARRHDWIAASLPAAKVYEDCKGERATLRNRLHRSMRSQQTLLQVRRRHRQMKLFGSYSGNALHILGRINFLFFNGLVDLVAGLCRHSFEPKRAKLRIGRGLDRGARLCGILLYLCGVSLRPYRVRPQNPGE
ncbi:glycosyltransferase [Cognatiyoonia sp. IB215182]|nr:glycosyltransferase [Cognatiyoonia sp. IB215182]